MVLVDANVLLDWLSDDPHWREWSEGELREANRRYGLCLNPSVFAELGAGYRSVAELERALRPWPLTRLALPYEAAFLAGQAFIRYRRGGGERRSPLPDFYMGAHAQSAGLTLLTRDATRYRTYFPKLRLIAPE